MDLISFLDENLPGEWKIFVEPYLNGSYPDLILLNPESGFMIYKIITDSSNISAEEDKRQLDYYRNKIIQELVPDMAEAMDKNSKIFSIIKTGVYVMDLAGSDARRIYSRYPYLVAAGCDDLEESCLDVVVPGVHFPRSRLMRREWAEELEFWLDPPYHRDRRSGLELTREQKIRAEPKPGHRRLRGSAGSGKTVVIAHRAAKLASEGYRVLVVTYNRTLWYYIKDMVDKTPYNFEWSNITFRHFHGFCRDILNELMLPMPDVEDAPLAVEEAIKDRDVRMFDSILIDEGQDYEWEWYNLLSKFLSERDELFFVCDKKQNVYDRELNWIDNMGDFKGKVKFKGRWPELNTVYRLPKEIAEVSNSFSREYSLDQSVKMDFSQSTLSRDSILFRWENVQAADWLSEVFKAYRTLKDEGVYDSDMVILVPKNKMGVELVKFLKDRGVDANHLFPMNKKGWRNKKTFTSGDRRLKVSTIHKFKGWEAPNVVMVIPQEWMGDGNLDSVVYTAMTRTLKNLVVVNPNKRYRDFGENLQKEEVPIEVDEEELELWMETLPYPLASILWASLSTTGYQEKVRYLLQFFEALSRFNLNLLLSGLSRDEILFETEVSELFMDLPGEWFENPSHDLWNKLLSGVCSIVREQLEESYTRTPCLKLFGNPKVKFLKRLSSSNLVTLLEKVSGYSKAWEDAPGDYEEMFDVLQKMLWVVRDIIQDSFKESFLVKAAEKTSEGVYSVKRYMTTRAPFRSVEVTSRVPLDGDKIYLVNKGEKSPLELLPFVLDVADVCYYYDGNDPDEKMARYVCYYQDGEILVPFEDLSGFLGLVQ